MAASDRIGGSDRQDLGSGGRRGGVSRFTVKWGVKERCSSQVLTAERVTVRIVDAGSVSFEQSCRPLWGLFLYKSLVPSLYYFIRVCDESVCMKVISFLIIYCVVSVFIVKYFSR